MLVPVNYLGVILIWSTTPLAIQWSGQGVGFLFAVTSRMVIGVSLSLMLIFLMRLPMVWHRQALYTYLAAGLGIYGAMMSVYWSAQYIPSGWIAVLFGFTPIVTGLLANRILGENSLSPVKILGLLLGLMGLAAIFYSGTRISDEALYGVAGILFAVLLHSISTVLVKKTGHDAHGLVVTAGGLLVAVPLYLATWFLSDSAWPVEIAPRTLYAIGYLGVIATVLGFAMFFYILRHVSATRVALLTLITPVIALLLGHILNGETVGATVLLGTALIMLGLALYEWSDRSITVAVDLE